MKLRDFVRRFLSPCARIRTLNLVAQTCSLPYRRIAFCGAPVRSIVSGTLDAQPITNRRYSRWQICATVSRLIGRVAFLVLFQTLLFPAIHAEVPSIDYVFPPGGKQGSTVQISVGGKLDPWPLSVWTDCSGLAFKTNEAKGKFTVEISTNAPVGSHLIRFFNQDGASAPRCFVVGHLEEQPEKEPNDNPDKAQVIDKLPVTINGRLDKADDSDSFAVKLEKDQWLVASVEAYSIDSPLDPVLQLRDGSGAKVAFNHDGRSLDPLLDYRAEVTGTFILQLGGFAYPPKAEVRLAGGDAAVYRLTLSCGPVARYVFPPCVQRGKKSALHIFGWNLGQTGQAISYEMDASGIETRVGSVIVAVPGVDNRLRLPVADVPEELEAEPNNTIDQAQPASVPCAFNGNINPPGDEDRFAFKARKGDRFQFRVDSAKLGFPLDAVLKIEDQTGKEQARGDDTGRSADPELNWTAPADGTYVAVIADLIQRGGNDFVYRLEMNHPRPDFKAVVEGHAFRVEAGKGVDIKLNVSRLNGFAGDLLVVADGLPAGVSGTTAKVSEKGGDVVLKLSAADDAKSANQVVRVLAIAPDLDAAQVHLAVANLKGQNAAAGDLLINQTDNIWLTVIPKRPAETKPEEKSAEPAK